ncbi:tyrosine-type recombinase/integrase [Aquimarina macrocephali]|uniref:tyrosine-type recombinase/integrase n=1 Tax=Aquimarina macrocephali TaxID=666563 RepID=UPI003F669D39
MKSTFKLKHPKSDKPTLIYFRTYFKDLKKSFIYSTGESINPDDWDFKNHQPLKLNGKGTVAEIKRSINKQLNRYKDTFNSVYARYKTIGEELTIDILRNEFNKEFEKSSQTESDFIKVYDLFLKSKTEDQGDKAISNSTLKRYKCNKNLLIEFQEHTKAVLSFSKINDDFYNRFLKFCTEIKKHSANTLSRNVGLFKTFMFWSVKNNYTYNLNFQDFAKVKRYNTQEISLTKKQIEEIYNFDLKNNPKLAKIRDLFVLGATTGFRFGNYSRIRKEDIYNDSINVVDVKDSSKSLSVPLNKYSNSILEKYNYDLPKISNQKFNDYIKDLFKLMEYDEPIKKTMRYGKNIVETTDLLYNRITSHTARRSFITILKNEGIPDKVIMSYTGHSSIEMLNLYYKPTDEDKITYMNNVFN